MRLIKKSAQEENFELSSEMQQALSKKDKEILDLKAELKKLRNENELLLAKIQKNAHLDKKLELEKHLTANKVSERQKEDFQNTKRG